LDIWVKLLNFFIKCFHFSPESAKFALRILTGVKNRKSKHMANHKSAKKRIRQDERKRTQNRYYKKSTRTAIQKLRGMTEKSEAETFLPKVLSMVDRLAKRDTWHSNKASNLKGKLMRFVSSLS
jgi:small subunit ribosomal protein S20